MKKFVMIALLGASLLVSVSSCKKCKDCSIGGGVTQEFCGDQLTAAEKVYSCK